VPAVVAAGTAVVAATEGPVPAVAAVPAVVAAETAVVPATENPVPAVATVSIWHSSDRWYWTLSGCNDCHPRSHNSWHSSDGWYWILSGWNDCRSRSHNSWHRIISMPAVVAAGTAVVTATEVPVPAVAAVPDTDGPVPAVVAAVTVVVPATEGPVPAVATVPAVVAAGMAVVTATEGPVPADQYLAQQPRLVLDLQWL
jgi:hypothetical protein